MDNSMFDLIVVIVIFSFLIGFPLVIYYFEEIRPKNERNKILREMFSIYKKELELGIPKEQSIVYDKIKNMRM